MRSREGAIRPGASAKPMRNLPPIRHSRPRIPRPPSDMQAEHFTQVHRVHAHAAGLDWGLDWGLGSGELGLVIVLVCLR